jgi:hypothetical protein
LAVAWVFPFTKLLNKTTQAVTEKKDRPIETDSLTINIMALIIFLILAKPMIEGLIFNQNFEVCQNFMAKRSDEVIETLLNSIKL